MSNCPEFKTAWELLQEEKSEDFRNQELSKTEVTK